MNGLTEIKSCSKDNLRIVHSKTGDGIHIVWTERDGHVHHSSKFGVEQDAITEYINRRILLGINP